MIDGKFTEEDKDKLVKYLNLVHQKATLNLSPQDILNYAVLLGHVQKHILPKIEKNILEILEVTNNQESN